MTICHDKRPCFARTGKKVCTLLNQNYDRENKPCPFCKANRDDVVPTRVLFQPKPVTKLVIDNKLKF